ncbi:uncharacterized protein N7500_008808 [Penicillium coprophilum]|uniref:uncharacterized protein n=1 Tax=Penicillium coprophilum TaxID=36646 RepID=UPI0023A44F46|nr:uncharacterized protein N7500_008808 [Penicillium coprophilum]KAJ5159157.1 hypothetical protein N7500_008808 [Penicillium coprophilum]
MGIVESRVLANNLLTACDQAEKEGKHQLDEAQFWRDTETIRISKSIYKYIPQTIRRTSRQSAIKKAIARSSVQLQVSPVIQGLQDKRESLFPLHSPGRAEGHTGSSANLKLAPLSCHVQPPLQTSSLEYFYNFIIYCEQQQELDKIRLRILYVAFYRLKNAIQPSTRYQYDDISLFIAHAIRSLGSKDLLPVIESRVQLWVGRGERYDLIARDLGGLGALYILPEDGGESLWTKELPKSATNPNRIAMIKGLCEQGLPKEAERRGLHILAEDEIAKVLGPMKAALDQVIETHLSAASFQAPRDDRRPRGMETIGYNRDFLNLARLVSELPEHLFLNRVLPMWIRYIAA